MKSTLLLLLATPVAAVACGPWFYPAPPTLDRYPERLPGKTARRLLQESLPAPAAAKSFAELDQEVRALAAALPTLPPDQARARIAAAQQHNRDGQYRKRFADALLDMEDLVTDGGVKESGAAALLAERMKDMAWDDGILRYRPKDDLLVFDGPTVKERQAAWDRTLASTAQSLADGAQGASPVLRPHWLVLAGAWQFQHGRFAQAKELFHEIALMTPRHPRAEIAQLMLLRATMEEDEEQTEVAPGPPNPNVAMAFDAFTKAWPHSRFQADLPLWRAGWLRARGFAGDAIELLIEPLGAPDHPETRRRAARELDLCLDDWSAEPKAPIRDHEPLPLDAIAQSPLAALAVAYHFLDSASGTRLSGPEEAGDADILDDHLLPMLQLRQEGGKVLPELAKALGRQPPSALSPWRTRYLAVLAWASTQAGDHRQALQVCRMAGGEGKASDDLAFVEAVAWQRAGELEEAEAAFTRMHAQFPESPLQEEVGFRLTNVLRDQHKEARAITELMRLLKPTPEAPAEEKVSKGGEAPSASAPAHAPTSPVEEHESKGGEELPPTLPEGLHLDSELDQWLDHLLHFAPLPELEKALAGVPASSEWAKCLRQMLRWRLLAREKFAEARQYAPPGSDAPPSDDPKELGRIELTGEPWKTAASSVEQKPAGAGEELALAERWAALRFQFVWPTRSSQQVGPYGEDLQDFDRLLRNATLAKLPAATVLTELESRDELHHALPHWLAAASGAPGTPAAAQALEHANEALHLIALRSPWHEGRAFETGAGEQSRALYERLRKETPGSPEAQRAVWWTFPPPAELREYEKPDYEMEADVLAAFRPFRLKSGNDELGRFDSEYEIEGHAADARRALDQLATHAEQWDEKRLLAELAAIRKSFLPWFVDAEGAALINSLDDLTLFLHQPKLTPLARINYFHDRFGNDAPNVEDPVLQPWRDFLEFLALVRERGPIDPTTDRARTRPMTVRMREFLQKYPHSPKREAAMARLAIAAARESHGHAGIEYSTEWRRSTVSVSSAQPEQARAALEALAAYEREFPKGRYTAEMRFWGGVAAMDAGNFAKGLPLLLAALDSRTEPDLNLDAALNLAAFFLRFLEEPAVRPAWLGAMRTAPAAQQKLFQFIHRDGPGSELLYLEDYLRAQL